MEQVESDPPMNQNHHNQSNQTNNAKEKSDREQQMGEQSHQIKSNDQIAKQKKSRYDPPTTKQREETAVGRNALTWPS